MKNFKQNITNFHYKGKPCWLFAALFLPGVFYFLIIFAKNFLYKIKILKEKRVNAKVICVGNLTTGGVGKTPVVIEIGNYLAKAGKNVAILSRGYGASIDNKIPTIVKAMGKILIDDPELIGDEVNLISKNTGNLSVVICKDRVKGANYAISHLNSEIILMDDGFSNRKIYKDLNIVLIDENKMLGNGFVLPLGPLREPVFEIKRADKILFVNKTKSNLSVSEPNETVLNSLNQSELTPPAKEFIEPTQNPCEPFEPSPKSKAFARKYNKACQICTMETGVFYNIKTGEILHKKNVKALAFCAIGQPDQFYEKLENLFTLEKTISFDDHFKYNQKTVDEISQMALNAGAEVILTTEKDMVKLLNFNNIENIYALKLKTNLNVASLMRSK